VRGIGCGRFPEFGYGCVKWRSIDLLIGPGQEIVDAAEVMSGLPIELPQDRGGAERLRHQVLGVRESFRGYAGQCQSIVPPAQLILERAERSKRRPGARRSHIAQQLYTIAQPLGLDSKRVDDRGVAGRPGTGQPFAPFGIRGRDGSFERNEDVVTWRRLQRPSLDQVFGSLRESEHFPVGDLAAGTPHFALQFAAGGGERPLPRVSLLGIARVAYFSRQQRDDDVAIAPAAKRSAGAPQGPDHHTHFGRPGIGKQRNDHLLETSAPDP